MKILVGISGGVDSAVSAWLLKQQGHEVVGGFMKNYVSDGPNCTTRKDAQEAIKVCKFLGIKLMVFDFVKEYNEKIVQYIYEGYQKGITPNPDVLCNNLIKFDLFLNKALELGFDKIATGHYSNIIIEEFKNIEEWRNGIMEKGNKKNTNIPQFLNVSISQGLNQEMKKSILKTDINVIYKLIRGTDKNKDQSYFLSGLNQFQLSKSIFPIGEMTKPQVRELAKKIGLPNADRPDSQGLCFIGNIPIKKFLEQKLEKKTGKIINLKGEIIGEHPGARFYTIGQGHGFNLGYKGYVVSTDVKKNIIVVDKKDSEELNSEKLIAKNWHWISGKSYELPMNVQTKIRYRQEPQDAKIKEIINQTCPDILGNKKNILKESDSVLIEFSTPQRAVAPGQIVVAYDGEECLGNGIIS